MYITIHQTYLSELKETKEMAEKLIKAALIIECPVLSQQYSDPSFSLVIEEVEVKDVKKDDTSEDEQPLWIIQVGILVSIHESISLIGYQNIERTLNISWV